MGNTSDWTNLSAGNLNAAEQCLRVAMGNDADRVVTKINNDPQFVADVALFMKDGPKAFQDMRWDLYRKLTKESARLQRIMGSNIFDIGDAIKYWGVDPTIEQLAILSKIPFSDDILRRCKDTHILVAVFPLSIIEMREPRNNFFEDQTWYEKQTFANERGEVGWQLVRKTAVENSFFKYAPNQNIWEKQQGLLTRNEETPTAQILVYTIIGHFLDTGERLFSEVPVNTSSVATTEETRVAVGWNAKCSEYSYCTIGIRWGSLPGLSSARKPYLVS